MRGSPFVEDAMVFSVGASDGTPLKVENLLDARLEATCFASASCHG